MSPLLFAAALASEPALTPEAAPAPAPAAVEAPTETAAAAPEAFDPAEALALAQKLAAAGAPDEARVLLEWVLSSRPSPELRDAARATLDRLPRPSSETGAVVALGAWQMVAGGWLLGPNNAWLAETAERIPPGPLVVFAGGLVGGAGGLGGTLWYSRHHGLTNGKANNIFLGEALGAAHATTLTLLVDEGGDWAPAGLLVGTVGGGAAGYYAASLHPDDGVAGATTSGALWGTGSALILLSSFERWKDDSFANAGRVVLAADLGALAGNGLARTLKLRPDEVKLGNLFGVAGGLTMLGFAAATDSILVWQTRTVGTAIEVSAIAGGAAGVLVARRMNADLPDVEVGALIQGTPDRIALALPVPSVSPNKDGLSASVKLVDLRF